MAEIPGLLTLTSQNSKGGFTIEDAPTDADLNSCVHCGLCLPACPTYGLTGLETESPRGRIFLIKALADGQIEVGDAFEQHINFCLDCRACETACPSGVHYGVLLEAAREELNIQQPARGLAGIIRSLVFRQIFPYPGRLNALAALLRIYQTFGLETLVRRSGLLSLLPQRLQDMESLLPNLRDGGGTFRRPEGGNIPARGEHVGKVALFTGCIVRAGFANTHHATIRVLTRNGWQVEVPDGQVCCAALHIHSGDREFGREMAKRNILAFEVSDADLIVANAAGCGSQLKEYGELLLNDAEWGERAARFSARVRDVTELLAMRPLRGPMAPLGEKMTYQEPCHLAHGQQIKEQPRDLLKQIPELELVEMRDADRCCGSAGIYNIMQPETATALLDEKMANIVATGALLCATANIGCYVQLQAGARRSVWKGRLGHVVEWLDESYRRAASEF